MRLVLLLLLFASTAASAFSGVVLWQPGEGADRIAVQGARDPLHERGRLDADTPLHIGSITKLFTAVLVLQQVSAGRLALEAPIAPLLPELPAAAGAITPRQLLTHQSGLAAFQAETLETPGAAPQIVPPLTADALEAQVLATAAGAPRAVPGSGFFYNNLDYLLLGVLLQRLTGKPYATLLDERIVQSLKLNRTHLATWPADGRRPASAPAVRIEQGRRLAPLATTLANYGAAGALVSTARDLSRFAAGLLDGRLLARPLREQLFAQGFSVWAYDFADARLAAPVKAVERQGAVGAYRSTLVLLPARRGWLIVLANSDGEDYSTWQPESFTHRLLAGLLAGEALPRALGAALPAAP